MRVPFTKPGMEVNLVRFTHQALSPSVNEGVPRTVQLILAVSGTECPIWTDSSRVNAAQAKRAMMARKSEGCIAYGSLEPKTTQT